MLNIVYVFVNSCVIYTVTPICKASIIILLPCAMLYRSF